MLAAGRFRHRITLQRDDPAQDPQSGHMHPRWVDVVTVWARIEPLSGRQLIAAQAAQSDVSTRIIIRWRAGVTADMRVAESDRVFHIASVVPDDQTGRSWLTLNCTDLPHG